VTRSVASGNAGDGFSCGGVVSECLAFDNGGQGVLSQGVVRGTAVQSNAEGGIRIQRGVVDGCTALDVGASPPPGGAGSAFRTGVGPAVVVNSAGNGDQVGAFLGGSALVRSNALSGGVLGGVLAAGTPGVTGNLVDGDLNLPAGGYFGPALAPDVAPLASEHPFANFSLPLAP
jgi:hypothetical protein